MMAKVAGRPPKTDAERRDYKVGVRFTEEERHQIEALAAACSLSFSEFVRKAALGRRLRATVPAVNREAWAELARVVSNLNQIAHRLNAAEGGAGDLAAVLAETREQVQALRRDLLGMGGDDDPEHHDR